MKLDEVMRQLEKSGTAQNRKVYARHGGTGPMFGVSFAALKSLAKKLKTDHELALALWTTGNHDARLLAAMIADPSRLRPALAEKWSRDLDNYIVTDQFTGFIAQTAFADTKMKSWMKSKKEWIGRAGWGLLARRALDRDHGDDKFFAPYLTVIERSIHKAPNRVRDAMNSALIAIALRSPALQKLALGSAKRIGKVEVDHGETSCKTPDAATYIKKASAFLSAREAKRKSVN